MALTQQQVVKLFSALAAKERAKLIIAGHRENREEDRAVRANMPSDQIEEFNRLIDLMNGVNINLGAFICLMSQTAETIGQTVGFLAAVQLFEIASQDVHLFLFANVKEPITESEYEVRRKEAERELIPLADLAELEADTYQEWAVDDFEPSDDGEEVVSDRAWQRVTKERTRLLKDLLKQGMLEGRLRQGKLAVRAKSYYDWKGKEVPVRAEECLAYEVVPDDQAMEVRRWLKERDTVKRSLRPLQKKPALKADEDGLEWMRKTLEEKIVRQGQLLWRHVEATRQVIDEVAREFDGEDPLRPKLREMLAATTDSVKEIASESSVVDCFELQEPSEEDMENVRWLVLRREPEGDSW